MARLLDLYKKDIATAMAAKYNLDPDPQARTRAVKVKVAAQVQPVIPAGPPGSPFTPVEFTGLTVTPYVNQAGRLAYSLKATGIRAPGRGRPGGEVREVAA